MAKRVTFVTLGEHLLSPALDCLELYLNRLEFEFPVRSDAHPAAPLPSDLYILRLDLPGEGDDIYGAFSNGLSWVFRARDGRASVQASFLQQFPLARQHRSYKINRVKLSIHRLDGQDWSVDRSTTADYLDYGTPELPFESPEPVFYPPSFLLDLSIVQ